MGDWPRCVAPGFRSPVPDSSLALAVRAAPVADRRPGGRGPSGGVTGRAAAANAAKKDEQNAKDAANNADTALLQAKAALAAANAHLARAEHADRRAAT